MRVWEDLRSEETWKSSSDKIKETNEIRLQINFQQNKIVSSLRESYNGLSHNPLNFCARHDYEKGVTIVAGRWQEKWETHC